MKEYEDMFNPYFLKKPSEEFTPISPLPKEPKTTMSYVPFQTDSTTYEPELALQQGTLFPDLDKPFLGRKRVMDI